MMFQPLEDRILVRQFDAEEVTAGGIIIPDAAQEKPSEGEVLAIGPGRRDENGKLVPIGLDIGDKILYSKFGGTVVNIENEELLVLSVRDVLGKYV